MDGVNESDENGKILLDPGAEKQTFGRKSQKWPAVIVDIDSSFLTSLIQNQTTSGTKMTFYSFCFFL
ncbi:hypothetical protein Hanom_Chr16g01428871 [Helianthus anomalus]